MIFPTISFNLLPRSLRPSCQTFINLPRNQNHHDLLLRQLPEANLVCALALVTFTMSAGDDLRAVAFTIFFCLMTILNAPRIVSWPITFSLSYSCYITICPYVPDARIFLKAAWDVRHLYQLSEFCNNFGDVRIEPERRSPWYESWVRCRGERWALEKWRTYRDYTSPHFLLLYIGVLVLLYFAVKHGGPRLLSALNNLPLDVNEVALSDNTLALPGAFNNLFPLDHVTKLHEELDKTKEKLKNTCDTAVVAGERRKHLEDELRKANERPPCPCDGIDVPFLQKRIQFLEYDLTSARSSEDHYKKKSNDLERILAKKRSSFLKQGARTTSNMLTLEKAATPSKGGRNSFCSCPLVSGSAAEDGERARLKDALRSAEKLETENGTLKQDLEIVQRQLATTKEGHDLTESELRLLKNELTSTQDVLDSKKSEAKKARKDLKNARGDLRNAKAELKDVRDGLSAETAVMKGVQDRLNVVEDALLTKDKEVLELQKNLASTKLQLNERQQFEFDIQTAEKDYRNMEAGLQQARHDLAQTQSAESSLNDQIRGLECTISELEMRQSQQSQELSNYNNVQRQLASTTNDRDNLNGQLILVTGERDKKEVELQHASNEWQKKKEICNSLEAEKEKARAEIRSLHDTIFELYQQLGNDPDSVYSVSEKLKTAVEDQRQANNQNSVLRGEIQRLKGQKPASPSPTSFASNTTDVSDASSKVAQLEAKRTRLLISLDEKIELLDKNKKLILKLQQEKDLIAPELDGLRRSRIREQKKAEELQGKVDNLKTELGVQRQKMDEAQKRAREQRSASHKMIIDLREADGQVRLDLTQKIEELAEAKKMVEEQGVMISRLQDIDDLF